MSIAESSELPRFLIVVTAFDRAQALARLLESLRGLKSVDCSFDLLISIDGEGHADCQSVADAMVWEHGSCRVLTHKKRLGLKQHIETSTDRVSDYDALVLLEDDLTVSPWMLHYCVAAHGMYANDEHIAQISLYRPPIDLQGMPFKPLNDGYDVWFARLPSSCGQLITRSRWQAYRDWQHQRKDHSLPSSMPQFVEQWRHSWKRSFFEYISIHQLWVVYPQRSLTTNHGNPGMNHEDSFTDLQIPLEFAERNYRFCTPERTLSRYDEWLEPMPDTFALGLAEGSRLQVDLKGGKPLGRPDDGWMLSTKPCSSPMARFSAELVPLEMNVRFGLQAGDDGPCIALGRMGDFADGSPAQEVASRQIPRALRRFLYQEFRTARRRRLLRYKIAAFLRRLFGFEDAA